MKKDLNRDDVRKSAWFALIIVSVAVAVLRSTGRSWWCDCGTFVPWSWDIWSSHNSQHLIDPYLFTHVLHGLLLFGALHLLLPRVPTQIRFLIAVFLEACWEILENSPFIIDRYRTATISLDYYGDSIANSVFDIIACAIGYIAAASLRWWWSVELVAVVEIMLLLTIRDCLTLNIIMLVCPLDTIKQWQTS